MDGKWIRLATVSLLALSAGTASFANDSAYGDFNSTIRFVSQHDISINKESLLISKARVEVDYLFTNTSSHDITIPVAFPMPPRYYYDGDHTPLQKLHLKVDGKQVKTTHRLVIEVDGQDVTQTLTDMGWKPEDIDAYMLSMYGDDPAIERKLRRTPLPKKYFDKSGSPRFAVSDYYLWQQTFPAHKTVAIHHDYVPSIETGVPRPLRDVAESFDLGKTACMDDLIPRPSKRQWVWSAVKYILVTGNNWQGAIKDFTLTIKRDASDTSISLCFDGKPEKPDPMTLVFRARDFHPKDNLTVLYLNAHE